MRYLRYPGLESQATLFPQLNASLRFPPRWRDRHIYWRVKFQPGWRIHRDCKRLANCQLQIVLAKCPFTAVFANCPFARPEKVLKSPVRTSLRSPSLRSQKSYQSDIHTRTVVSAIGIFDIYLPRRFWSRFSQYLSYHNTFDRAISEKSSLN